MTLGASDRKLKAAAAEIDEPTGILVRFLRRGEALRRLPVWSRYLITTVIVLAFFTLRYAFGEIYGHPYLAFVVAVILASFLFDRGSGFLATGLSALLAVYFSVEPGQAFRLDDFGEVLALALFVFVGLLAASVIEALRVAVEKLTVTTEEVARSRHRLAENLSILETVIESSPDAIFVKDLAGYYRMANAAAARMIGVAPEALIGKRPADFLPEEDAQRLEEMDRKVLEAGGPITFEEQLSAAGEGPRWFATTKSPWRDENGSLLGIVKTAWDIHDRKLAEEGIREASRHKELLLQDINHRVKNHLQSMIATLGLSRRQVSDLDAGQVLDTAIARLRVLGRVYDRLELKSGGDAVVSVRDFIDGLCNDLRPALLDLRPIALHLRAEPISLELGRVVPLGLIVNEALTNALKYAFPDDAPGNVSVIFEERDGAFHLEVSDDGVGIAESQIGSGAGTKLIRALAQQLGGTLTWQGPPGTCIVVRFPTA